MASGERVSGEAESVLGLVSALVGTLDETEEVVRRLGSELRRAMGPTAMSQLQDVGDCEALRYGMERVDFLARKIEEEYDDPEDRYRAWAGVARAALARAMDEKESGGRANNEAEEEDDDN